MTVGIICEYNPLHLGHFKQITRIREQFGSETAIVCVMSGDYVQKWFPDLAEKYGLPRKPNQIIHPWQFGHGETKATCLWLIGLAKLVPTEIVSGREQRVWKMPPSENRSKLRSKTFLGIAKAMAEQWAGPCKED